MKYVHTFTRGHYIVAVVYRNDDDIDAAAEAVVGDWTDARCEEV